MPRKVSRSKLSDSILVCVTPVRLEGTQEERGREGEREGGREGGREREREGGRKREGRRGRGKEGGREREREGDREKERGESTVNMHYYADKGHTSCLSVPLGHQNRTLHLGLACNQLQM